MATEERTIPASQFRDQCLRLMDEINETGATLVVTKHGKPVAIVGPAHREKGSLWGFMKGTTRILGDIDSPAVPPEDWDIVSNPDRVLDPDSCFIHVIVLDTNVLLRMTAEDPKIGKRTRQLIDDAVYTRSIAVPAIVFFEAARLHWDKRVDLGMPPEEWRLAHIHRGVTEIHLTGRIAVQAADLHARQGFHRDPGDQIIAATAIAEKSTLATTDGRILEWATKTKAVAVLDATD